MKTNQKENIKLVLSIIFTLSLIYWAYFGERMALDECEQRECCPCPTDYFINMTRDNVSMPDFNYSNLYISSSVS
jgi:hypothetical protein